MIDVSTPIVQLLVRVFLFLHGLTWRDFAAAFTVVSFATLIALVLVLAVMEARAR